jgi:uncharacterized iron-regulated membrane protein
MSQPSWRKWHRWVGFVAFPLLLFAAVTGLAAGVAEMTSEDEEAREKTREKVSPVTIPAKPADVEPVMKALGNAVEKAKGAPVDKVTIDYKPDPPTVTVYLGKPTGGEDRKLIFDHTGKLLKEETYEDKPFLTRLHSGEAFGDWGLVFGTVWGLALVFLLGSGLVIYLAMKKPGRTGLGKVFW